MFLVHIAVSLLPVVGFLAALSLLDSYKLVRLRLLLGLIGVGALVAVAAWFVNTGIVTSFGIPRSTLVRYVAPVTEEVLKGVVVVLLVLRHRVGFLVDAAIVGFAIGTGFACVENTWYLWVQDAGLWTWLVRGFGTAIMHGGSTAIVAIFAKLLADRHEAPKPWVAAPGLAVAFVVHSLFNHAPPLIATGLIILLLPPIISGVFAYSERLTRDWITSGFDADQELLILINTGAVAETRVGRYLAELKGRFPGPVVVDMLCLLRLEMELSIRAKGMLMMRAAGFPAKADDSVRARLDEVTYLEKSIGTIGLLAIDPFMRTRGRDRWQRNVLEVE